jgi:uncharacterized protein (DUF983 family)
MPDWTAPDAAQAALRGLCPRCGAPGLFDGIVRFVERCPRCGLDFTQSNVGDGPAAFLIMIVGGVVTGLATWLQISAEPPLWVHLIVWPLVTAPLVVGLLRVAKGALLVIEFQNRAEEGRLAE